MAKGGYERWTPPAPGPSPDCASRRLASALTNAALPMLAQYADEGRYDDERSPLRRPKTTLVEELRESIAMGVGDAPQIAALIGKVIAGDYDNTPEEARA